MCVLCVCHRVFLVGSLSWLFLVQWELESELCIFRFLCSVYAFCFHTFRCDCFNFLPISFSFIRNLNRYHATFHFYDLDYILPWACLLCMSSIFLYLGTRRMIRLSISCCLISVRIHNYTFSIRKKHLYFPALNSSLATKCWLISSYTFCMHLKFELFITVRQPPPATAARPRLFLTALGVRVCAVRFQFASALEEA